MSFSVNTNVGAMTALQELNRTAKGLAVTQGRITSGKNVNSTRDDSATFITAQGLRGKQSDLKAVTSSLNNAKSVVDIAVSGAEQISDLVNQMKTLAKQSADNTISPDQRTSLNNDFQGLLKQITVITNSAEFNGKNLLTSPVSPGIQPLQSLANVSTGGAGTFTADTMTVPGSDLALPSSGSVLNTTSSIGTASDANTVTTYLETYNNKVKDSLSALGSASRQIDSQLTFTSKLSDTIETGIGNLVDADLAKESAKLQALQTKQQLGVQALSIANQAPQTINQLFKG